MDNPFLNTGFSYSYGGVGKFDFSCFGYINAIKITDDVLTALFRKPIEEPYMIHASCNNPNQVVYISRYNEKGFDIRSCIENDPIRCFSKVMASISKCPEEFFKSDQINAFCNISD